MVCYIQKFHQLFKEIYRKNLNSDCSVSEFLKYKLDISHNLFFRLSEKLKLRFKSNLIFFDSAIL